MDLTGIQRAMQTNSLRYVRKLTVCVTIEEEETMSMKDCKDIRQEIDQAAFADQQSAIVREHLRGCPECTKFEAEQRSLQGMLASLGTIAAPADFDFRLRARLAREKSVAGNGGALASFLRLPRPLVVAALVLVLVVGGIVVKNWLTAQRGVVLTAEQNPPPANKKPAENPGPADQSPGTSAEPMVATAVKGTEGGRPKVTNRNSTGYTLVNNRPERRATRDDALSSAAVLTRDERGVGDAIVRVPLDDEGLRISIDDGRGSRRTISIPRFSFGSQRLTGHSFVPVSNANGVW